MTVTYVTVILDRYDGAGNQLVKGGGTFTPSLEFPDAADRMQVGMAPVPFSFRAGGLPSVEVLPNDLYGPQQDDAPGWTWNVTYSGVPGDPADASYYILSTNGLTQYLSDLASVPAAQPGQQYVPLPSTPPADDTLVLGLSSSSPLVTDWVAGGGGSGTVTTVSVVTANGIAGTVANPTTTPAITLSVPETGLLKSNGTAVSAATAGTDYLAPGGSGAALTGITAAQVGADASGAAAAAQAAAEAASDPAGSAAAVLATSAQKSANLSDLASASTARTNLGLGSAATQSTSAFDASGAAATAQAASLQKSANLSDLASASTARTNLGLGSAATQASSAFDASGAAAAAEAASVPVGDLPLSIPNGGTGQETQQAALDALAGAVTSGLVLRGNGSHVTLAAIQAGDVPTLNQSTTGTAANLTGGATFPAYTAPHVVTLSQSGGLVAVNAALGNDFRLTLTVSGWTISNPTNPVDGQEIVITLIQDATGGRTVSWDTAYAFTASSAPVLVATASTPTSVGFKYLSAQGYWECTGATGQPGVSNPVTIAQGGTGSATQQAALDALAGAVTANQVLGGNGTHVVLRALAAADIPQLTNYAPTGLTGATAASRYAGATASGAPVSGTFATGDFVIDQTAKIWICTSGGSPGSWSQVTGSGGSGSYSDGIQPSTLGVAMLTADPRACAAQTVLTASAQQIIFALVTCAVTQSITKLGAYIHQAGTTPGGTGLNQMAIYPAAGGSALATTGDMTTALESTGWAEGTISSTSVTAGTNYYLALINNFTGTGLGVSSLQSSVAVPALNGTYFGGSLSGRTTWPSLTPSALSTGNDSYCMYAR